MKHTRNSLGLLGAALLGGMVMGNTAFAVEPLSQGYQLASAKTGGEGKCGEGKCGGSEKASQGEGKCGEGKCGGSAKATQGEGKCGEGKCGGSAKATQGEGKCGEGKCGDASFARTDTDHDGRVSRAEFLAVAKDRAADFDKIDTNHDGFISEQEAHDFLQATYAANGKKMPAGLFANVKDKS